MYTAQLLSFMFGGVFKKITWVQQVSQYFTDFLFSKGITYIAYNFRNELGQHKNVKLESIEQCFVKGAVLCRCIFPPSFLLKVHVWFTQSLKSFVRWKMNELDFCVLDKWTCATSETIEKIVKWNTFQAKQNYEIFYIIRSVN